MPPAKVMTPEAMDAICERLALGESLRSICADDAMPCMTSVFKELRLNEAFAQQYALAREAQAETLADEIIDIADDGSNDWIRQNDPENDGYRANGEAIQRSRLRVDARKWIASKLMPKKYGDRVMQEITGKDGGAIETADVSDRERAKAMLALISKAESAKAGD